MNLELAIRLTEIMLGLAFIQQSAEHLVAPRVTQRLFVPRIVLSILLIVGLWVPWVCAVLAVNALFILKRFQGPYNGGSDRMSLLVLCCLFLVHLMSTLQWKEYVFGYLALQLILSYFSAGWVKIANPEWRSGRALQDVFRFSAYPVSESLRGWADKPRLLCLASWAVIAFELAFPFTLLTQTTLIIGLTIAAMFHLANAFLFGLNRFFWVWLAAYPSILWLQQRVFFIGEL
jgi:hypothetical protein